MLCSTYYELNCNQDTDEVKQAFDDLYQTMTGKTLKEKDEVIYVTCRLCSLTNKPASSTVSASA